VNEHTRSNPDFRLGRADVVPGGAGRSQIMNTQQLLAFHTAELLEAHRQLSLAGVITHLNGQPLTISQRCAIAREALVAWGSTQSVLKKAMQ
jgi:hypothetical protein